jgi:putative transcriptional regulator
MRVMESLQGKLLVASPAIFDPNFRRTVVLVTAHNEEGAVGLILNRPSEATVAQAVEQLSDVAGEDARIFVGGPVNPSGVAVLAEFEDPEDAASLVLGDIGFLAAEGEPEPATRRARVFAGYAGWSSGQLEAELEEDAWILEPARPADVFAGPAEDLWGEVLRRKGGQFKVLSLMPPDLSLN